MINQINVGVIGTGWCGGIRANACHDNPLVNKLFLAETNIKRLNELKKSLVITTGDNYVGAAKKQLREKMSDLYSKVASSYDKPSANELENLALIENEMKSANKRYSKILKKVSSTLLPEKSFEDFINE